jgi:tetratricopeptide (TPR) repeat protein
VERRLAVHAGGNSQALTTAPRRPGPRGAWTQAIALVALVAMVSAAEAKPRRRDARVHFDRGVAAYQKGSYEAASDELSKAFNLEHDPDTLFAWAQAERKLEHCDKAIDLYGRLLAFPLPAANKTAVEQKLDECRAIVAMQKPEPTSTSEPAVKPPAVKPPPAKAAELSSELAVEPPRVAERTFAPEPAEHDTSVHAPTWYTDPVAIGLLGAGLAATGIGAGVLISAKSLDDDANHAASYDETVDLNQKAKSRAQLGLITTGAGGALVAGGILWIVLHRGSTESRPVSAWVAPGGAGIAVRSSF